MLTHLRLKNFKAWRDSGTIRFAPLTVLFGTNSSGKTSITQLLLMLKQTAESRDRLRPLQLGDDKKLVDLGTYVDIVYGHDLKADLEFQFGFTLSNEIEIVDPLNGNRFRGNALDFSTSIVADVQEQPTVSKIEYTLKNNGAPVLVLALSRRGDGKGAPRVRYELTSKEYSLVRRPGRAWPLPSPVRFYGFPDEVSAYYQNAAFTADLALALEQMLRSIYYVGPLREYPHRYYQWSGEVPNDVGIRGDQAVEAILAAWNRSFNWKPKQRTIPMQTLVADRLKQMGLIESFKVNRLSETGKVYEVLLQTAPNLPKVKLTDVGFGLSQVLPVIVECFYVPARSIVLFEQPEIHLHPKVQADLADLFVDAVRAREDGQPRECQFVIESHSEHFLRRLQRRIAEEEIKKDDAALYFVHTEDGEARIEELDVDDYGNIKNWPDGFFGDDMADLVARREAQAKRMRMGER